MYVSEESLNSTPEANIALYVNYLKLKLGNAWVAQSVKRLPSGQVMIPGSWDQVLHRAPCLVGSLLLPLPATPSACVLSQKISKVLGRLGGSVVKSMPSAQDVIPESWDRAPHQTPPLGARFFLSHSTCLCSPSCWLAISLLMNK